MNFWDTVLLWIKRVFLFFLVSSITSVILLRFIPPLYTPLMIIRAGQQYWKDDKVIIKKDWTNIKNISIHIQKAVIASEDQEFLTHFGFDIDAMKKAYKNNQKQHVRRIKGGSTITQQVAKNLFLWPGRSYLRKIIEAYFTLLLEIFWSKERIMEMYLNIIELGKGIYGIEAASRIYFKIPAKKIKPGQAALIAATIPNPLKWSPLRPTLYINKRQHWILGQMYYIKELKYKE